MRVRVDAGGRVVEIESSEQEMTVHRLANIAIATWRRTESDAPERLGPASGAYIERRGQRVGFTWNLGEGDQLDVR